MSIEEIKKDMNQSLDVKEGISKSTLFSYIQTLLSSLEKEEQAHTMSVYDLNMKIAEVGIALEREKERADKLLEFNKGISKLYEERGRQVGKLEERVKELEKAIDEWTKLYHSLQEHADKMQRFYHEEVEYRVGTESRLKDSEAKNQIYLQDIKNEQKLSNEINERLKKIEYLNL